MVLENFDMIRLYALKGLDCMCFIVLTWCMWFFFRILLYLARVWKNLDYLCV